MQLLQSVEQQWQIIRLTWISFIVAGKCAMTPQAVSKQLLLQRRNLIVPPPVEPIRCRPLHTVLVKLVPLQTSQPAARRNAPME